MRGLIVVLCVVLAAVGGWMAAPAGAKSARCKGANVQVKVDGKPACVPRKLALPPPSRTNPIVAGVQGALEFTKLSFKAPSGKRVKSFKQQFGRSWTIAQRRLQNGVAAMIARVQKGARRPMSELAIASGGGSSACAEADLLNNYGLDAGQNLVQRSNSMNVGGAEVTMGIDSSGTHFGVSTNIKGNTYTMKYDSGEFSCLAYKLPPCPHGDGTLNAYGIKGKTGYSMTVKKGGEVLKSESYAKTITVETRGQVADDAKLDYVDVKYSEATNVIVDGVRLSQYGNRTVRINMRTGSYGPAESVSFGTATVGGESANLAGQAADAKDFGTFVEQTRTAYREREKAWQTPNTCTAKPKFNPASNSLTLNQGDHGDFSAEVDAKEGGEQVAKASWTLGEQKNATFSPTSTKDRQPSFSYEVSGNPSGDVVSVVVRATTTAGVAQETWSQKVTKAQKISGTFTGQEDEEDGVSFDWSGTATFTLKLSEEGGSVYTLTSGEASVNVSGTSVDGCTHSGSEQIQLAPQGGLTVNGTSKPFLYQIIAPWNNFGVSGEAQISCPENNNFTEAEVPAAAALQSGDIAMGANPLGLIKESPDGKTFEGSASENDVVVGSSSWTWSLKVEQP